MRQQRIPVSQVCVRVNRDSRDLELSAQGALIQRLDVLQLVTYVSPSVSILPAASA
jgi:hypothetical protein